METKNNYDSHIGFRERRAERQRHATANAAMDALEFEQRQALQARLIADSGINPHEWIAAHSARFSLLYDSGYRSFMELRQKLYNHSHQTRVWLILTCEEKLSEREWNTRYGAKFSAMYENGDWEKMGEEAFKFILYNK